MAHAQDAQTTSSDSTATATDTPTTTVSWFTIMRTEHVACGGVDGPVTTKAVRDHAGYDAYTTRAEAQADIDRVMERYGEWWANHGEPLVLDIDELRLPAKFLVTTQRAVDEGYLGFGARVVAERDGYVVVGVPQEHAEWQYMRLASGMRASSQGHDTLEAAMAHMDQMVELLGPAVRR